MIKTVYLWHGVQLMVFDRNGQQMPDYQHNPLSAESRAKILADAPPDTEWHVGEYATSDAIVTRATWELLTEYVVPR